MTYLFNVKDTFTKEWMGYFYSRTCNRLDALMSVEDAITRHPDSYPDGKVPGTVLRCDNGDQYTSHYFMGSVKLLGFRIEFIEKSTPQQNGDVESFHNSLKSDYVWTDDFIGYNDAGKKIKTAFQDYNNVRPHSTVDYLPPSVFRDRFLEDEHFRKYYIDRRKEKEERYKMRKEKARRLEHKLEVNSGHA